MSHVRRSTLLIHRQQDAVQQLHNNLFEIALKYAHAGYVIFFTISKVETFSKSALDQFGEIFKKIIFFYVQSIEELLQKLLDLQQWQTSLPTLIIIESLDAMTITEDSCPVFHHALVMTCLADTVDVLSSKLKSPCKSIVTVSDSAYEDFPIAVYVEESYTVNAADLSSFTDILSLLTEMTYQP